MEQKDRFYHWKKHSGFKRGLKTDIVFGDGVVWHNDYLTTMQSEYKTLGKVKETHEKSAGKSSGFAISDRGQKHIIFGDVKLHADNESLTAAAFKAPVIKRSVEAKKQSKILKYHTKSQTITSAAHVGSETRQDLPTDDTHFKNFTTTTEEAYQIRKPAENSSTIYGAKPCTLSFGDRIHGNYYETTQSISFVPHKVESVKKVKGINRKTKIFNTDVSKDDLVELYTTTLSEAYKGLPIENQKAEPAINLAGNSNIRFGENPKVGIIGKSLTKSDFQLIEPKTHQKSQIVKYFPGIDMSLKPGQVGEYESFNSSVYKPLNLKNDVPAAGIIFAVNSDQNALSSVPVGDSKCYNLAFSNSTTNDSFVNYNGNGFATRVPVGSKCVRTNLFKNDKEKDKVSRFVTSTNADYKRFSAEEMHFVRQHPINPNTCTRRLGDDYSLELKSTQHSHYVALPFNCSSKLISPSVAARDKLFPVSKETRILETTMEHFYGAKNRLSVIE